MERFSQQNMDPLQMTSSFDTDLCELVTYTTAIDDDNDWDCDFGDDTGESPMILLADGTPVLADEHVLDHQPNTTSDSSQLSILPLSNLLIPSPNVSIEQQYPELQVSSSLLWKKPMPDDCQVGAYSCSQCSYTCDDHKSLRQHTAQHSTSTTLDCVYCSYKTISETHFARHITDHEIEKAALERGEELGHDFVFGSVSNPLQQMGLQEEEDNDWQIGCPQVDSLASDSISSGMTSARHGVGNTGDFLPTIDAQTASVANKGASNLKRNVAGAVPAARRASKRKNASREDLSLSSRPLTNSHSSNLITNGIIHSNANDAMENIKGTLAKKRVKITDYFGAMCSKSRTEQPSSSKSLRKTCGKWRCPHCPYSSKRKFVVEKHLSSHDLDNSSKENSFETLPPNEALLQPKEELPDNCHCDNNDYGQDNIASVDPLASSEMNTFNCSAVTESPLQTYLSKNRLGNNSYKELFSFNNHIQVNEFEKVTLLDCPFCTVRSRNQIAHENHITLCHIDEKDTLDTKNTSAPVDPIVQASQSSTRTSNRPSTSRYKKPSLQVTGSKKDGRNNSDFVELFDSDDSDHDFQGFHNSTVERGLAGRSLLNLTPKELVVQSSMHETSPWHIQSMRKRESVELKPQSTKRHDLKLTSKRASHSKHAFQQQKTDLNVTKPSTEQCRVSERRVDCNYSCPLCSFSTIVRQQFLNHINTVHTPGEVFVCRTCSLSSTNALTIENHKRQKCPNASLNVSLHLCPNCPFQSIYFKSYERHVLNCSRVLTEEGYDRDGKHMCPFCHYRSFDIDAYKEHLLNHVRSEALSCPKCPFKTSRKDMYRWHLKMEHDFVPGSFRCEPCDFCSINYKQYFNHMASHFPLRRKVPRVPLPQSIAVVMHQQLMDHITRERGFRDSYQSDAHGATPFAFPPLKYASLSLKKKIKSSPKGKMNNPDSKKPVHNNIEATVSKKTVAKKEAPFIPITAHSDGKDAYDKASPVTASNASNRSFVITKTSHRTGMANKESSPNCKLIMTSEVNNSTSPKSAHIASPRKATPKKRGRPRKGIPSGEGVPDLTPPLATTFDHFLHPAPALDIKPSPKKRGRPKKNDVLSRSPLSTTTLDKFLVSSPSMKSAAAKQSNVPSCLQVVDNDQVLVPSSKTTTVNDVTHSRHNNDDAIADQNSSPSSPACSQKTKPPPPQATVVAAQPSTVWPEIVVPQRAAVSTKTPVCAASSFVCPFCSQVFTSNTQLVRHVAVHTDRGRMTCPVCNFSTMEFPALQGHLRSLHQELCF